MSASCVSMPTRVPRISEMVPSSGSICPAMRRKSVDLPEPLTPIKPMRAPCWSVSDMSFRTDFMPKDFDTPCTVISIMRFPLCVYAPSQRPVAPQGSTPPAVTGSTISSAVTLPPRWRATAMVSMLLSTAGCRPVV